MSRVELCSLEPYPGGNLPNNAGDGPPTRRTELLTDFDLLVQQGGFLENVNSYIDYRSLILFHSS